MAATSSNSRAGLGYVSPPKTSNHGHNSCILTKADTGSPDSLRYFLARRTVFEMLRDRGCVIDESEITRSISEFRSVFGEQPDPANLRVRAPLASKPSKEILVIFSGPEEINKAKAKYILHDIPNKDNLHRIIIVLGGKMNHFARKEFESSKVKVEIFQIIDLLVNITKHISMPRHEILTTEEKEQLLLRYKLTEKQMPYMLESDAVSRYYGLEKNQVVKVIYNSHITGSFVTYRSVV